ncbi:helix-turn-helix domain-containing protein [Leisingera methylohalidivorans]|uniref:DNA-binding protein n=1 Tax=Leisingera methylohalidivorans DSM 14336 TaxID=999552 RepID=V9VTX7_9RHOB|nr:helix-turn-helix transcriptional regulator [Leisingera methylohalidivorans]AHD01169.1 DNA-binding protein [Leisingera methylohalidivorans DSM 14336]
MSKPGKNKSVSKSEGVEVWRKRLRQALDDRNLDYDKVSLESDSGAEYVSRVLSGRFNPTVGKLMKICEVANIDMAWLFSDDPSSESRSVVEKAADLSENDAELVSRLIKSARPR